MIQAILIGIGAGAASALLFASALTRGPLALILVPLSMLPVLLAGIAWSHRIALIAVATAATLAGLLISGWSAVSYLVAFGVPAYVLAYLVMLGRTTEHGAEWYPPGRIVIWAALLAAGAGLAFVLLFGSDLETYRGSVRATLQQSLKDAPPEAFAQQLKLLGLKSTDELFNVVALILPAWVGLFAFTFYILNAWLAARLARASGMLPRPWPDLRAMTFPPMASVLFVVGLAVSYFIPGLPGLIATVIVAILTFAHSLLGFAVLHSITQGVGGRTPILALAWISLAFGWPVLLAAMLGIADQIFDLRGKAARRRPPAPPVPMK